MKKTQVAVRDLAVLYIMSVSIPGNRESFLEEAAKAFDKDLDSDTVLRSHILHGYRKRW